jgi:hypothetical protein
LKDTIWDINDPRCDVEGLFISFVNDFYVETRPLVYNRRDMIDKMDIFAWLPDVDKSNMKLSEMLISVWEQAGFLDRLESWKKSQIFPNQPYHFSKKGLEIHERSRTKETVGR